MVRISIHVPREGDDYEALARGGSRYISIHVPREGDDESFYADVSELS